MSDLPRRQVMVEVKPWWESMTIRTNGAILVVAIVTFLLDQQRAGLLPFTLDEHWLVFIIGIIGVVNMWLRTNTVGPVGGRE